MGKKGFNWLISALVIAVIVYQSWRKDGGDRAPEPARSAVSYGERGVLNNWPNLGGEVGAVASNVTATNYYLVVDGSGSMGDSGCSGGKSKLSVAQIALKQFISNIPAGANVGFYAFDANGMGERLALGLHQPEDVFQYIDALKAGGGTPLSVAIEQGDRALDSQARSQLGYGEYHLVVVTDGEANRGYEPDARVRKMLSETPIVLHTVGFCINRQHSLNQPGYTLYQAANDPAALSQGLNDVLAEAPDFTVLDFGGGN